MKTMTKTNADIRKTVQRLRAMYVPTPAYRKLEEHFRALLEQRRADMADGVINNGRGIVLWGSLAVGKPQPFAN